MLTLFPATLPRPVRTVYDEAYDHAKRVYPLRLTRPSYVATTAVEGLFTSSGARRRLPKAQPFPKAKFLVALGTLMEIHTVDERGTLLVHRWQPGTLLFWSEDRQAVVFFEGLRLPRPTHDAELLPELADVYRTWHAGKNPHGLSIVQLPQPELGPGQVAVATAYRSDKFARNGRMTSYIHHHGPGVIAHLGRKCGMVKGGKLRLTKYGLEY